MNIHSPKILLLFQIYIKKTGDEKPRKNVCAHMLQCRATQNKFNLDTGCVTLFRLHNATIYVGVSIFKFVWTVWACFVPFYSIDLELWVFADFVLHISWRTEVERNRFELEVWICASFELSFCPLWFNLFKSFSKTLKTNLKSPVNWSCTQIVWLRIGSVSNYRRKLEN